MITYRVSRIVSPWMAGLGDSAGVPVSLVELDANGGDMGPDDVAAEISRQHEAAKTAAPSWVLVRGDERQMDADLLAYLKVKTQVSVAAEVGGMRGLGRPDDRTPMFDHVSVIVRLPADARAMRVQFLHSFVLYGKVTMQDLSDFHAELDRREYTGRRYVVEEGPNRETVARFGRGWRMTRAYAEER